ncbi:MAG: UbiA family prenyltransferase [Candidatus Micrarchaeota archaeon]
MGLTFKTLIELTAPYYLAIVFVSPFAAYLLINGALPGSQFLFVVASLVFCVLGFNVSNAIFDAELDAVTKPRRPIPSKTVSIKDAAMLAVLFYLLGLSIAVLVNTLFVSLVLLFILVTMLYNIPQTKLRNRSWGSNVTGAIIYGAIPFLSAYSVSNGNPVPIFFFAFFVMLFTIISSSKDFEDVVGESETERKSIPILLGEELTGKIILLSEFLVLSCMGGLAITNAIPFKFLYATAFSAVLFVVTGYFFWKAVLAISKQNSLIRHTHHQKLKTIVLQSTAVTISLIFVLATQLAFGLVALI